MAFQRLLLWMFRLVTCGVQTFDGDSDFEEVEIEIDVADVASTCESEGVPEATMKPLSRLDSLERGFQTVMDKARTFAHKWSQPEVCYELVSSKEMKSDPGHTFGRGNLCEMAIVGAQRDCVELEVERDSSQARFEHLMQRTSRFYQRCSMLQRHPSLLVQ